MIRIEAEFTSSSFSMIFFKSEFCDAVALLQWKIAPGKLQEFIKGRGSESSVGSGETLVISLCTP